MLAWLVVEKIMSSVVSVRTFGAHSLRLDKIISYFMSKASRRGALRLGTTGHTRNRVEFLFDFSLLKFSQKPK
jgi:hypothetical protein